MLGVSVNVRLEPGGPYEIHWVPDAPDGQRGSEGCTVVSFVPERSLTFTWNAPPSFGALREEYTQVTVALEPFDSEHVRVRLVQEGCGPGPERDAVLIHFDRAWEHVMAAVRKAHPG